MRDSAISYRLNTQVEEGFDGAEQLFEDDMGDNADQSRMSIWSI